jgi:branched-chain amino acid transport system ATP-binding protein
MSDGVLVTRDLGVSFGGLRAVHNVNLSVAMGEVHAVIGPNGAGKTTLVNLLSGDIRPSSGRVLYQGRDITGAKPFRVAALGIGRTYQITNIFPEFNCRRNCWLAARARKGSALRFFRPADRDAATAQATERALEMTGLLAHADTPANALSYGEQRQLEIAMLLALEPDVLLLDEPLAGMGADESQGVVELIKRLAPDHAVLLIEHDMDAVFAIADRLTVMVNGEVLESGAPEEIRASTKVRQAYLGDDFQEVAGGAS